MFRPILGTEPQYEELRYEKRDRIPGLSCCCAVGKSMLLSYREFPIRANR